MCDRKYLRTRSDRSTDKHLWRNGPKGPALGSRDGEGVWLGADRGKKVVAEKEDPRGIGRLVYSMVSPRAHSTSHLSACVRVQNTTLESIFLPLHFT